MRLVALAEDSVHDMHRGFVDFMMIGFLVRPYSCCGSADMRLWIGGESIVVGSAKQCCGPISGVVDQGLESGLRRGTTRVDGGGATHSRPQLRNGGIR